MLTEILIIFGLLLLNGVFAMAEMAIVSASKPLLRQYARQGRKGAEIALSLAENSGRFLSTVQVGITLVGILAGAFGGATIAEKLQKPLNSFAFIAPYGEAVAVFFVVASITYCSVVIGELVPKQLALSNSEKIAMLVARPMATMSRVMTPLVVVLEASAALLRNLLGIRARDEGVTESEIRAVIAEGVESGAIEGEEHDVIRRVFRLGDRDVKSIMTHRTDVTFIDVDDGIDVVRRKIALAGHSRYPVIDKDTTKVLGMVRAKQLAATATSEQTFRVADFISPILYLDESTTCLEALRVFRTRDVHIAAVIDSRGLFEGLFTISDLMEAIVGTLAANYDRDEGPLIVQRADGSWLVDGLTPMDEVQMTTGVEGLRSTADYQTIAGFVLTGLKAGPVVGASLEFSGHRFEIVDMDRQRIDKILIQRIPVQTEP